MAIGAMQRLRSITLTLGQQPESQPLESWLEDVSSLLAPTPLEIFQMYSLNTFTIGSVANRFWQTFVIAHGVRLTKFVVHRMIIGLDSIRDVCERCTKLEQLFIVIPPASLVRYSAR